MDDPTLTRILLEAEGFLELGMLEDSGAVLGRLPSEVGARTEVLALRLALHLAARNWSAGAAIARCLVERQPEDAGWWINLAYCVRRSESVEAAEEILVRAAELHPKMGLIVYNLACYACVTGRLELAKERLGAARALDQNLIGLALQDDDLFPIREWIEGKYPHGRQVVGQAGTAQGREETTDGRCRAGCF